jgi:hypothetical protein
MLAANNAAATKQVENTMPDREYDCMGPHSDGVRLGFPVLWLCTGNVPAFKSVVELVESN